MKKGCLLILLVVLVVGALAYGWVKGTYNGFVEQQESVKTRRINKQPFFIMISSIIGYWLTILM